MQMVALHFRPKRADTWSLHTAYSYAHSHGHPYTSADIYSHAYADSHHHP